MLKFSVLMSVYIKENPDYFKVALDSVVNQTLMPDQIVIVKDGPITNELEKVLTDFEKKYSDIVEIIELEKNCGLGIALNEGLKRCKYDIVARMDTDDYALENRFEKQISIFEKDKEMSVVGGLIQEYDIELKNKENIRNVPETDEEIKKFLKKRNAINHMAVMYKKNDVINAGSYLDCPYFEDYYLWCRMAINNCKFHNVQDIIVNVRAGSEMINRRGGKKYFKPIINFYKKIKKIGFINTFECIYNCTLRIIVAMIPNSFRTKFYQKFLRKK